MASTSLGDVPVPLKSIMGASGRVLLQFANAITTIKQIKQTNLVVILCMVNHLAGVVLVGYLKYFSVMQFNDALF